MQPPGRALIIGNSMDGRVVSFNDNTSWQLSKNIYEKTARGSTAGPRSEWTPYEAHAVYECVQVKGPQCGKLAIIKTRIE